MSKITNAVNFFDRFNLMLYLRVAAAKKSPKKAKPNRALSIKTIQPFSDGSIIITKKHG